MKISKRLQDKYRNEISTLASGASDYVSSYINEIRRISPDASVAEIREATKAAIDDALNAFGTQAGNVACELFDEIVASENLEATSEIYDVIDRDMMDKKVRYFAGKLIHGDFPGFQKSVTDLTRFYVKRTAFENVINNCDKNDIRYARVPSGAETCAFCFMLSSRGFVYHSEATANGQSAHGMHQHCDCIVIPGVENVTKIAGYNPDLMYERWKECARAVGVRDADANSFKNRQKIMDEVATRDYKWLYSGVVRNVKFSNSELEKEIREKRPFEIHTAERLAKYGINPYFVNDTRVIIDRETKQKRLIGLADLIDGNEIKTLINASTFNTIDGYIKNTSKKENAKRLYFDNTQNSSLEDSKLIEYIRKSRRFKNGSIYILDKKEKLQKIK